MLFYFLGCIACRTDERISYMSHNIMANMFECFNIGNFREKKSPISNINWARGFPSIRPPKSLWRRSGWLEFWIRSYHVVTDVFLVTCQWFVTIQTHTTTKLKENLLLRAGILKKQKLNTANPTKKPPTQLTFQFQFSKNKHIQYPSSTRKTKRKKPVEFWGTKIQVGPGPPGGWRSDRFFWELPGVSNLFLERW